MVDNFTPIGSDADQVSIRIDGQLWEGWTSWTLTRGILQQPSTFSFTVGSGDLSRQLMARLEPFLPVQMFIGSTPVFTGELEDPSIGGGSATEVTVQGRDLMYRLVKNSVLDERQFGSPTYFELTREVMDLAGMSSVKLVGSNEANREKVTRVKASARPAKDITETLETGMLGRDGAKVTYNKITGKLGQSWFDFLVSQYRRIGLYLWSAGDGTMILCRPTANQDPVYEIRRERGLLRTQTNAMRPSFANRTSGRHAMVRVFGKGWPDKKGQRTLYGDWPDFEMYSLGDKSVLTMHDSACKTTYDCQHRAKRHIAEERRTNRTLSYPLSGLTIPSLRDTSRMAIWSPDTVVKVSDDEIQWSGDPDNRREGAGGDIANVGEGLHEDMYVEKVEMKGSAAGTTTTVHLMRGVDIYYLGEENEQYEHGTAVSEAVREGVIAHLVGDAR
jgi:prophage tail gpP-like protein